MDVQRKKGILEVCVLAVLKKGPSYGYMVIRELEQCIEISESTLYPILKRLEQNGSLKTYRQEYNGRLRKYYQLTEEGQRKIDLFLDEWDELQTMYQFVAQQNREAEPDNLDDSGYLQDEKDRVDEEGTVEKTTDEKTTDLEGIDDESTEEVIHEEGVL